MKAKVSNYRQAPRKVRLIANLIRGKRVVDAVTILTHLQKRGAGPFKKLVESALANAKNEGLKEEDLIIKEVRVDSGFTFKRFRPRARGRASSIHKHTSNILVKLGEVSVK